MKTSLLARKVPAQGCKEFPEIRLRAAGKKKQRRLGFLDSDLGFLEEMTKTYPITSSSIHVVQRDIQN